MENISNELPRTMIAKLPEMVGQPARICGWVQNIRTHGKIVFFDVRDASGIVQTVFVSKNPDSGPVRDVRPEWVLSITGMVQARPISMVNEKIATGKIEFLIENIDKLSKAITLPFSIDGDGYDINEGKTVKISIYRFKTFTNYEKILIFRHQVYNFIRKFLTQENFIEIDTPYMTKSTPEGARDYLVPARVEAGKFYALAQSPQQYKQLLMAAGMERYFQIARCFRDEDTRGDRQPEFTQLDEEMSFVQEEEIMQINEKLIIELVKTLVPEKRYKKFLFRVLLIKKRKKNTKLIVLIFATDKKDP